MSYPEVPVIVDWCITARVKGDGQPQRFQAMGLAEQATVDMIAWLKARDRLGDKPRIELVAELTSEQLPGWEHEVTSKAVGMAAEEAVEYSVDWLRQVAAMENWGGSR